MGGVHYPTVHAYKEWGTHTQYGSLVVTYRTGGEKTEIQTDVGQP